MTVRGLASKPTLLLHVCCAPCSSGVLEELAGYFDITVFFYNPNIQPKEEYILRRDELKRFLSEVPFSSKIAFAEGPYDPNAFTSFAEPLADSPEGSERCFKCFSLRLGKTSEYAKEKKFDYFTTTLSISPLKNAEVLNKIGLMYQEKTGVSYLLSDFKKKNRYQKSIQVSHEYNLYRQNYCGCLYSKKKSEEKYDHE